MQRPFIDQIKLGIEIPITMKTVFKNLSFEFGDNVLE